MKKNRSLILTISILTVCFAISACSDPEPPKSIQDINSSITSVKQSPDGKTLTITIKQGSIFDGAGKSKEVLEGIMKNFNYLTFDNIEIIMDEILIDQYGKESVVPIVQLNFPRSEIEKINFTNVVGWNILNISTPQIMSGSLSTQILKQECSEENNAKYASIFCNKVLLDN